MYSNSERFHQVAAKIDNLSNIGKTNLWLKSMSAQLKATAKDCNECTRSHLMDKLIYFWEKYGSEGGSMTAVIWPFRFKKFVGSTWEPRIQWVSQALQECGYEVQKHSDFHCRLPGSTDYKGTKECDVVVYNHAVLPEIKGDVIKAEHVWFFKPTIPDVRYTTLDVKGYGPYSSITYSKPPFHRCTKKRVGMFFENDVSKWIQTSSSKWGVQFSKTEIPEDDFNLVVVQTLKDYTTVNMYYGSYLLSVVEIVQNLVKVDRGRSVVVKLHPYIDGKSGENNKIAKFLTQKLEAIDSSIRVYSGLTSVHPFFAKCRCVFVCNSGAGWEAMMHRKPVVTWGYPEYHWTSYKLRHLCDLSEAIKLDWFKPERSDKLLYWYLRKYCFWDYPSTLRRVRELLNLPKIKDIDIPNSDARSKFYSTRFRKVQIKRFPRTGGNYVAALVELNFFSGSIAQAEHYYHCWASDDDFQEGAKRGRGAHTDPNVLVFHDDVGYIMVRRRFKDVAKSLYKIRGKFGLINVTSFEEFLAKPLDEMWSDKAESDAYNLDFPSKNNSVSQIFKGDKRALEERYNDYCKAWDEYNDRDNFLTVHYEELLSNFQEEMLKIAKFLGSEKTEFENIERKVGWVPQEKDESSEQVQMAERADPTS